MIKKLALAILLCASTLALAQTYPSRPVRLVVGFAPGGAADFVSRAFQDSLGKALGQPIVVENRPGAGSSIAAAHAKKNPGKLNFATSGNGSAPHLAAVLFLKLAGVEMVHVPFKGGAPAVQSVLAGDTQLAFATPPSVLPLVQAARLRALAVTSRAATPLLPGIPGMGEALPDYEISFWYGFFVPAGTPPEVVRKLFDATSQALKGPELARILAKEGTETASSASPEEFARFLAEDAKVWARLVKESG